MTIQWFPGHMTKTKRQLEAAMPQIDVIIEVCDARVPLSSRNPILQSLSINKPRIILLNKRDLADPRATEEWMQHLKSTEHAEVIPYQAKLSEGSHKLLKLCEQIVDTKNSDPDSFSAIKIMIVGIPNVGKSALINQLSKRAIAKVANRPAVTQRFQWIRLNSRVTLLDTPGILWPKFEDQQLGLRLAISGAIRDPILDMETIAFELLEYLQSAYPEALKQRYGLESLESDSLELMSSIALKRGCILRGKEIDFDKTYKLLVNEFRSGKLGRISLERP